ncbi:DUF123 domain-containing protein [Caldivirga sp.]|uniref:GIY-YIG nuclease family protein n=1 Tax=Caldivirga sp. TaxID=2080243 RepID=UPI0025BE96BB|nr:GIY-YIG nuclease family protein [Caldivirga sp.]
MQCVTEFNELSTERGTYVLILNASSLVSINVASLGQVTLNEGYYAYVGSAKVGIKTRVGRHIKLAMLKAGKLRWHLDYVLVNSNITLHSLIYINNSYIEHEVAQALYRHRNIDVAVRGFGSSDCNCVSHFFKLNSSQDPSMFIASLIKQMGYIPCILKLSTGQ